MTTALDAVTAAVSSIAPDVDPSRLDDDLYEDLGLDSMDLLNLAAAIAEGTGVEIPERDYGELRTLRALADYVSARRP